MARWRPSVLSIMSKAYKLRIIIFSCLVCILASGCSSHKEPHEINKTAQQLAAEGAAAFMNEDYKDAIQAYSDLKDWYSFSKYVILAELKIADAHFHLEEYPEAIEAYKHFEEMHPKNDAVPYVINQIGTCWFKQIDTIDREAEPAQNAMVQFERLVKQFPDHELSQDALAHIDVCIDNIAGHELYVANFYFKTKKYQAALNRYQYIVENYAGTDQSQIALSKIPKVTEKIKETEADEK